MDDSDISFHGAMGLCISIFFFPFINYICRYDRQGLWCMVTSMEVSYYTTAYARAGGLGYS